MSDIQKTTMYIIFIFILISGCASDQPYIPETESGSIVGVVKPVGINAQVSLIQGKVLQTVAADSATGYFEIPNVTPGIYNIEFSAQHYGRYVLNKITVLEGKVTATPDVFLNPLPEQLLFVNPPDSTTNVPLMQPFEIEFTIPMNQPSVESNFTTEPYVSGYFVWENSLDKCKMSFFPQDQFETNRYYTVMLRKEAKTIYGDTLSFDVETHFKTEGVKVVSTIPQDQATFISPQTAIYLTFNSKMNRSSVESAISITPVTEGDFRWLDSRRVSFQPGTYLKSDTDYIVTVGDSALDACSTPLSKEATFSFRTEPLMITSTYPADGATFVSRSTPIVITFNTLVEQKSAEFSFTINPPVENWNFQWSDMTRFQYMGTTKLEANTEYTVIITSFCTDLWGKPLPGPYGFKFTTGN